MRYWKVEMGNGYCGCDEEFLTKTENEELDFEDCLEMYSYTDGAAGLDPDDEDFEEYPYSECISDNTSCEEITEEEFLILIEEDGWEVR